MSSLMYPLATVRRVVLTMSSCVVSKCLTLKILKKMALFNDFQGFRAVSGTLTNNQLYDEVLYAQGVLESRHFTSSLCVKYYNIFGMHATVSRPQPRAGSFIGSKGSHWAIFQSAEQSIADRIAWDNYNGIKPPTSNDDILRYMNDVVSAGYNKEKGYVSSWVDCYNSVSGTSLSAPSEPSDSTSDSVGGSFFSSKVKIFGFAIPVIFVVFFVYFWLKRRKK